MEAMKLQHKIIAFGAGCGLFVVGLDVGWDYLTALHEATSGRLVPSLHVDLFLYRLFLFFICLGAGTLLARVIDRRDRAEESLRKSRERLAESKKELEAIYEAMVEGVLIADVEKRNFMGANAAARSMFGYSGEEFLAMSISDIHPQETLTEVFRLFGEMAEGRRQVSENVLCRGKGGRLFYADIGVRHVVFGGRPCLIGFFRDITERKKTEDRLRLAAKFFASSNEAIVITDPSASILDVNDAYSTITGYRKEEVVGRNPRIMKSGRHDAAFYREFWRGLIEEGQWQGEIWDRRKSGEIFPKWLSVSAVRDEKGGTTHYVGFFSDITVFKQTEERLKYIAHYDTLTGLPNRFLFQDRLGQEIARAQRTGLMVALFFLDLDRFKAINDTLGHHAGDILLIEIAGRLRGCIREIDTVARLGGDEFTVILPDMSGAHGTIAVAKKMIEAVSLPVTIEGHEVFVTVSIGITFYPTDGTALDELTKNADTAMYHAKEMGKNNFQFFTPEMNANIFEQLSLESGLRHALEREEFVLHYQPRVELKSGRIAGMEALVRWSHPELGMLLPPRFIPIAEETGLIIPLGEWILKEALREAEGWMKRGAGPFRIAVNFSSRQFSEDLPKMVGRAIEYAGISPESVEVELTESIIMGNIESAAGILRELKEMKVRIAIDDFGTGYSSLNYLKKLPVDILKIDQSFIKDISLDPREDAIVAMIIDLAHALGVRVIAEGVETAAQLSFLKERGCDEIQGYYYSTPLHAEDFFGLLKEGRL